MNQTPIYFENAFEQLNDFVQQHQQHKFFFLVDQNTHEFCLPLLLAELPDIQDIEIIEIPAGEESKSIEVASQVWSSLVELGADRNSIIINCGGGVVTDFGGFVASTFKRGVKFIHIPTSLLAMVDAAVGGKTGVNLGHFKNQIGTFSMPEMVIISPMFLKTLAPRELLSGFAEMLKHGLIRDKKHWQDLAQITNLTPEAIAEFISTSIDIKKNVVEQDPTEQGLRKILNAGHTLGHALESYFLDQNQAITHGEAVALGLLLESYISLKREQLPAEAFQEIQKVIIRHYSLPDLPNSEQILTFLLQDKKNVGAEIQGVLLDEIGHCNPISTQISITEIDDAFDFYKNF